ncbi:MAG: hypothetical protein ACFFAS_15845 [Promethearchaeota archaeon]
MMLQIVDNHGNGRFATITEVTDSDVKFDMNHPLAGKVLNFKITVLETGCEPDPHHCGCGCESEAPSDRGDGCTDDCGHFH